MRRLLFTFLIFGPVLGTSCADEQSVENLHARSEAVLGCGSFGVPKAFQVVEHVPGAILASTVPVCQVLRPLEKGEFVIVVDGSFADICGRVEENAPSGLIFSGGEPPAQDLAYSAVVDRLPDGSTVVLRWVGADDRPAFIVLPMVDR